MKSHIFAIIALFTVLSGCHTQYSVQRSEPEAAQFDTVVFVRPERYSPFLGTLSLRDYVEVVYEQAKSNNAGMLEVTVGLRNKGGKHFYDTWAPNSFPVSVRVLFFEQPLSAGQQIPVYETNWQTVVLERGSTQTHTVLSLSPKARYYQVVLSELVQ